MFTSEMRESEQAEITLPEINDDVLQDLVNYCYTGSITIREDIIESLLKTSRLMQLDEVTEACSQFLARQLHPSNCLGIADFAEHHNCDNLLHKITAYVHQNFMEVIRNEEFLQLRVDQIEALLASKDELYVTKEQCLLQAMIDWINVDSVNRKLHMARLLGFVKLPLVDMSFLANFGENVVGSDVVCLKLINQAMLWHLAPERRSEMINWNTIRPQKTTSGGLLLVGFSLTYEGPSTTIQSYDPLHNTWTSAYNLCKASQGYGIAVLGDNLLVVGGLNGGSLEAVECLDLKTGTWSQYPAMNIPRCGLGVAVLNGSLYAVGGQSGRNHHKTVEKYDPISRQWSFVAPMAARRDALGVAVLGGKLYAVGGRNGNSLLRTVECYDPLTNKWTFSVPMIQGRSHLGVAVFNGCLYAIGGQNGSPVSISGSVERYDPETDTWTAVASLSSKHTEVSACLFGDRIVAVGNYTQANGLSRVEQYDPKRNEWSSMAPLITNISPHRCCSKASDLEL